MARIENLIQNGRGKYTSGTVEVRRNLCLNPGARTSASGFGGWSGTNNTRTVSIVQASWSDSGMVARNTYTNVQTNDGDFETRFSSGVTAGKTYTIVFRWSASRSGIQIGGPRAATNNKNAAIVCTAVSRTSSVTAVAGEVYTDWATFVAPSMDNDPAGARIFLTIKEHQIGDYIDSSMADIYEGEYQENREWFDGSYSPDPDLTPSWTGTENASASVLSGKKVVSLNSDLDARAYQTEDENGNGIASTYLGSGANGVWFMIGTVPQGKWVAVSGVVSRKSGSAPTAIGFMLIERGGSYRRQWLTPPGVPENPTRFVGAIQWPYDSGSYKLGVRLPIHDLQPVVTRSVIAAVADTEAEALAAVQTYFDGDSEPFRYGPTAQLVIPKWSGTPGQSSSYFDYEEPWTVGMQWDKAVDRRFELGVDRGVLYNRSMVGVPWNGLINVTEKLTNTELTRYYQDGSKYYTDQSTPEFSATVEAFTYPDILDTFTGKTEIVSGLYADEKAFQFFHFSYRTLIGDAIYGSDKFYKIHLVYHAYAVPTSKAYGTINESPSASTFSWDVTTDSISMLPGTNSLWTSHLIIDSRKVSASKLKNLETILYGTSTISPRLPLPAEVQTILA